MVITKYFEQQWDKMTLIHPETKKEWYIEIDQTTIHSRLGAGKISIKEVDSSSFFPPFHRAIQLVMAKLRKGFIYYNPKADVGEAVCHRFVEKAHTGFLPIATRRDRDDFYITRVVGDFEDEILVHYSGHGEVLSVKSLGAHSLTFSMWWDDERILYLDRKGEDNIRKIHGYNVNTPFMQIINEFSIKSSNAALTQNNLVLHSDYGIISIYKI